MKQPYQLEEDLLCDELFLAWYERRNESAVSAWEQKMNDDPALRQLSHKAAALLAAIVLREKSAGAEQTEQATSRLLANLPEHASQQSPHTGTSVATVRRLTFSWKWAAAAAVFLAIAGWIGYTFLAPSDRLTIATAYGEIRAINLPDGSSVTLNANTQLRYTPHMNEQTTREVWINGEAFFHVRKTTNNNRFIVHTNKFDVTVTGTQFNVTSRPNRAGVLLREGAVAVGETGKPALQLVPGDWAVLRASGFEKKQGNPQLLTAWTEHRMVFEKTPLIEVATLIEENFGVKVTTDPAIAETPISGGFPTDNLDLLLNALGSSREFRITRDASSITFGKK